MMKLKTVLLILSSCPYMALCESKPPNFTDGPITSSTEKGDKFYCDTSSDALDFVPADRSSAGIGGQTRYWFTYTPPPAPEPLPLVIDLHGYLSCASFSATYTGWKSKAEQEGFYAIWPQGTNNLFFQPIPCWNAGSCCCIGDNVPDSDFIKKIIDRTLEDDDDGRIDPKRIYLAGHSNGCFMAQTFVADYPGYAAGIACHAGVMGETHPDPNDPGWIPTATVIVHGDADETIGYPNNDTWDLGAELNTDLWGESNGCTKKDIVPAQNGDYTTHTWSGCDRGVYSQLIQVHGADHYPYLSYGTFDTTGMAWNFIKNFSLDPECSSDEFYVQIEMYTDENPTETSFTIAVGSPGNVVVTKDDYVEPNFKHQFGNACVPSIYCFYLTVYDSSGNGLSGDSGYQVYTNSNLIAESSFDTGFQETVSFGNC